MKFYSIREVLQYTVQQEPEINLRDELKNVENFLIVSTWFYTMISMIFIIIILVYFILVLLWLLVITFSILVS